MFQEAEAPHDLFDGSGVAVINTLLPSGSVLAQLTTDEYTEAVAKALGQAGLSNMPILLITRFQLVPLQLPDHATGLLTQLTSPATAAAAVKLLAGPEWTHSPVGSSLAGLLPDNVAARLPLLGMEHACSAGMSFTSIGAPPFNLDASTYKCVTYRTNVLERTIPVIVRQWQFSSSDDLGAAAAAAGSTELYCSFQQLQDNLKTMSDAAQAAAASGDEGYEQVAVVWHRFKAADPAALDAEQLSGYPEVIHKWLKEDLGPVEVEVRTCWSSTAAACMSFCSTPSLQVPYRVLQQAGAPCSSSRHMKTPAAVQVCLGLRPQCLRCV